MLTTRATRWAVIFGLLEWASAHTGKDESLAAQHNRCIERNGARGRKRCWNLNRKPFSIYSIHEIGHINVAGNEEGSE